MNALRDLWRLIVYAYHENGCLQVLYKILRKACRWVWSETAWLVYCVQTNEYQRSALLSLDFRDLGFKPLCELGYFKALAFPEATRRRLKAGALCHGFFLERKLVNVAWTTSGHLELEAGVTISRPRSIGISDCYTLPAYRSKGIYRDTLIMCVNAARRRGVESVLIGVDPDNLASIKGIERAGFEPLYCLKRLCRFGTCRFRELPFQPILGKNEAGLTGPQSTSDRRDLVDA